MPENNIHEQETERRHLTSAERQKLYQERATQRRLEEYKKRKRARYTKIALIALAVLFVIGATVACVLLEKNVWKPTRIYDSANALFDAENYLDAYDVYISLGDYKDAASLASSCIVKNAQKLAGRDDVIIGTSASMPWFKIDENGAISFDGDKYKGATELTVPDGVTSLGEEAFANNGALERITIPASVTALGGYVFSSCGSLTEIAFAEGGLLTVLPDGFVSGCKKLTAMDLTGFTALGERAFYNTSLQTVILSDSLTSIGARAFNSTALTEIVIPASVTEIGEGCFWNCPSLQTVAFAEGSALTRIPTRFVMGCPELTSVTLPDTLAWVDDFAFAECPKLPMTEYEGCLYLTMWNNPYAILCDTVSEEITEVTIHPDTRHVAGGAFSDCEKLTAVILPEGVVSVGSRAFRHCYALASVQLPDSLRYIADYAFYACAGELEPTLPADLAYIGIGIFEQCRNERVYYQGTQAQWEAIPKHEEWISRYDAYDLICADGVIRVEG